MLTPDEKLFLTTWLMEIGPTMHWEGAMPDIAPATGRLYRYTCSVWMDDLVKKGAVDNKKAYYYTITQKALDELGE
jgi:hypothetical protein